MMFEAVEKGLHCVCMFLICDRAFICRQEAERKTVCIALHAFLHATARFRPTQEAGSCEGEGGVASNRTVREKLAIASAETYKTLRNDMDEIIKTSDWKHARGVGFTEVTSAKGVYFRISPWRSPTRLL